MDEPGYLHFYHAPLAKSRSDQQMAILVLLLQEAEEKSEVPDTILQSRPGCCSVESGRGELGVSKTPRLGQQKLLGS